MRSPTVTKKNDNYVTRIRVGKGLRHRLVLQGCASETAAKKKAEAMVRMADQLAKSGHSGDALKFLKKAAATRDSKSLWEVRALVDKLCRGKYVIDAARIERETTTFRMLGERWTSGQLHREFPHHVKKKATADDDAWRLEKHVYPHIGGKKLEEFSLDDAERVMKRLPASMASGSRRQVAQVIHRILVLAVYPCRIIEASPIPRGWLPKPGPRKAVAILYPDEEARFLSNREVPIGRRVAYGYLHREGHRKGEVVVMTWSDLDLERGVVRLDRNKTDHPRMWKLGPGVAAALSAWKQLRGDVKDDDPVFVELDGARIDFEHLAATLRDDLKLAGITRPEIYEKSATRMRFGVHGIRHSFVTRSLAIGKTEDWVRIRTGHKSNELWRYREMARSLEELEIGDVLPLDEAIPELGKRGPSGDR